MQKRTRVRFAPSPTGPLHMGGVRTALYNYLFAKQRGGDFILRIEDTDSQRFVPGSEEYIIEALTWCGILPDEGVENGEIVVTPSVKHPHAPYRQSLRKGLYRKYAEELVAKGYAYYAFDTPGELERLRSSSEAAGKTFTYNYSTRNQLNNSLRMSKEETERLLSESENWVIRFKMAENRNILMNDAIRGEIEVNSSVLDDKVLWKAADQLPTYHLANIVDDHLMEITDVIRGEEWLPSLPLHYLLYEALGWEESRPSFAHLPLLLKPDGKGKLSKRDGDRLGFPVFPLEWKSETGEISKGYREEGYYPEAFVNLLAFLGWNPGTEQEIFSLEEMAEAFSLERVVKSGARFNPEKARWYNQEYLRMKDKEELTDEFLSLLESKGIRSTRDYAGKVAELIRERACFANELLELSDYLFAAPAEYDRNVIAKYFKADSPAMLQDVNTYLKSLSCFDAETLKEKLPQYIKERGWQTGVVMNTLRLALVGASKGPGIAEIMELLGREDTCKRIEKLKALG
ncbi:MAG: glutamate--tRNA ligase [Bacteroidales bacterium]|nr:glutamate--tRNA ligase [Bacteroidales bacterium]